MVKPFKVMVFGKTGCDKCGVLNQRVDKLLVKEEWKDFEKLYCDVESEEGIVRLCEAECVNPQRLPALLVTRQNAETGEHDPVARREPGKADPVCGKARLYQYLGLQTDYRDGGGVLTPQMISAVLSETRA
ncbi:MAG: hypothetical protein QME60_04785 [Verrucomicrobiota bacterium]|nr:hypothetical protein [Verrucomicrobiota bacterium]